MQILIIYKGTLSNPDVEVRESVPPPPATKTTFTISFVAFVVRHPPNTTNAYDTLVTQTRIIFMS